MSNTEVAEAFGVGRWFVQKLLRQRRATGSLAALPRGRGPDPLLGERELAVVGQLCRAQPDATLDELRDALEGGGGPAVGRTTMFQALRRLDLPLKKSR